MRQIKVKASVVKRALARANRLHDDWQAGLLEILLLPNVHKRWSQINAGRFPNPTITRHKGKPHKGFKREDNLAVKDWSKITGYVFGYGSAGYTWNRAREDWYGHSPSTTWDGVRRETRHAFVEALRTLTLVAMGETDAISQYLWPALFEAKVEFIDDLSPPLFSLYKFSEWASQRAWYLRAINLSERRALRQIANGKRSQPGARFAMLPWKKQPGWDQPDEIAEGELPETAITH